MQYSLRTKLSLSYVLIALLSVLLISILVNFFLDKQFKDYVVRKQEARNREIVRMLGQQYSNGRWSIGTIENIGVGALSDGLIVKVQDKAGKTIWDARAHNNGLCVQMIDHMALNMQSRYPNWKGGYVVKRYPLASNFQEVGTVEIGYFGPYFFNDNDLVFINTLNKIIFGVGIIALICSLLLGAAISKRLASPISRVIASAQAISQGYFGDRIGEESDTREINQLTATINNLAATLEKQEQLRKRLTADVAHELRTPLATLRGHLEAMIDGVWEPDQERLKSCHEEIMRLARMVGDLTKLARYESEQLILNKTEFDLAELTRHLVNNFESDCYAKGVAINVNGEQTMIAADRDKISQVIQNLLSNALKYTPSGGRIDVSVSKAGEKAVVRVKDSGIGIAPEDLPYIFERFYRADKSRNRMTGGMGIGLAIVKAIVNAHQGTIEVASELKKGTEVTVTLPADDWSDFG